VHSAVVVNNFPQQYAGGCHEGARWQGRFIERIFPMSYGAILEWLVPFFGVTSTFAYLHQAFWIWRRRSSADVSLFTFSYFFLGQLVMLLYSIHIGNIPYIIVWIANMTGSGLVIVLTVVYRRGGAQKAVSS
jgi:uncharacterized protein with PQ loop repeat